MEIDKFREHVRALAALRQGDLIYNATPDHASVIIEQLFASANDHARILSGELQASIYGNPNIVQRAKEFLGHSDHHLEILVERHTFNRTHPLIAEIGRAQNLTISAIKPDVSARIGYHFMTADDDCYRFERRKDSCVAIAAFGRAKENPAAHLNGIFAQIAQSSEKIDMQAVFAE
jgi:hypothetical protein